MFGLEDQKKKKKNVEFIFDLEKELQSPQKNRDLKKLVETRIQSLKASLREGESKESFHQLGLLLHGYTALLKVLGKVNTKAK